MVDMLMGMHVDGRLVSAGYTFEGRDLFQCIHVDGRLVSVCMFMVDLFLLDIHVDG